MHNFAGLVKVSRPAIAIHYSTDVWLHPSRPRVGGKMTIMQFLFAKRPSGWSVVSQFEVLSPSN
jgi:hypothetical protein